MIDQKTANKLRQAGVDSSIILSLMLDDEEQPAAAQDPVADPDPAPGRQDPEPQPAQEQSTDAVLQAIEKLTGAVQLMNQRNNFREGSGKQTTDDILASIIRPEINNKN